MKNEFLPKALNGMSGGRVCLNINIGPMSTELHYHDCVEIICVRRGMLRVFFGNGWRELNAGSLIFVPPGCIHRCVACDGLTEQVVIGFTDELICSDAYPGKSSLCPYRTGEVSDAFIMTGEDSPTAASSVDRLWDMGVSETPLDYLRLTHEVILIYSSVYEAWERLGMLTATGRESPWVNEIKAYVSENFTSKISARELSGRLNISYSYLAKLMRREFGMSLGDCVISARIENAKRLLLSTKKSITEIGYECGFSSSSAFIFHFKALTGKTPFVFRNEAFLVFKER